jgi:hypothetical protein
MRLGPVLEFRAPAPRSQPAHVRALAVGIGALEILLGGVGFLVPVLVLLDDAEVDERAAPDVSDSHGAGKS